MPIHPLFNSRDKKWWNEVAVTIFNSNLKILYPQKFLEILNIVKSQNIEQFISCTESISQLATDTNFNSTLKLVCQIFDKITNDSRDPLYEYNAELVNEINNHIKDNKVPTGQQVTITMTSCKRNDLLKRTINSMLENFQDFKNFVVEVLVVDDNSSDDATEEIQRLYPFVTLIKKTIEQKGHPQSMNLILDMISTPYIFHLEDDFEFFRKRNYLTECMECLNSDEKIGQTLININYAEDCNRSTNITGSVPISVNSKRFHLHQYFTDATILKAKSVEYPMNCLYWPHFSFRPSLIKSSILKEVGRFNSEAKHFEMEWAQRYAKKGYISSFLDGIFCNHIGRRTYERNTGRLNAYDLNQERQFGEEIKKVESPSPEIKSQPKGEIDKRSTEVMNSVIRIETSVINLKRRRDRLLKFVKENNIELPNFKILKAVDGMEIQPNFFVQKLFATGDFNYRRGIVGVALSQIKLWKELCELPNSDYALILEDDAKLTKNFMQKVLWLLKNYHTKFDLMFLHWLPYPQFRDPDDYLQSAVPSAKKWSKAECMQKSMGSATCYLVNKRGAKTMLQHIDKYGVYNGIDWVMFKCADEMNIFYSKPMLAFADCVQGTSHHVDSDIQRDYNSCGYKNPIDWSKTEVDYWIKQLQSSVTNAPDWIKCEKTKSSTSIIVFKDKLTYDDPELESKVHIVDLGNVNIEDVPVNRGWIWYTTDKILITVPHSFVTDEFLKTHQLFSHRLQTLEIPV